MNERVQHDLSMRLSIPVNFERLVSRPRLSSYLDLTDQNLEQAFELYAWNLRLSGATYQALAITEVALRNALDFQLRQWNRLQQHAEIQHHDTWLLDPAPLIARIVGKTLATARARAIVVASYRAPGTHPTHDDILANIPFGTWRYLLPTTSDPGKQRLWNEALQEAFPHLRGHPARLIRAVDGLHRLRNRIAHLEPIMQPDLLRPQQRNIRFVLACIDPELRDWTESISSLDDLIAAPTFQELFPSTSQPSPSATSGDGT